MEQKNEQPEKDTTIEKVTEQQKGSDAAPDQTNFNGDMPSADEAAEEIKGSDADYDQGA
jgi:hypothetical protein